jgi:hypothetical protein
MDTSNQDVIALMNAWTNAHPGWEITGDVPAVLGRGNEPDGVRVQVRHLATGATLSGVGADLSAALQNAEQIIEDRK